MRGDRYATTTAPNPLTKILIWAAGLILVILLARFIGGGGGESLDTATASLKLSDTTSSAEIIDSDSDTKDVNANTPLAPLDLIEMKNGTGQVLFLDNARNSLGLNTGTKIRYIGPGTDGKIQFRLENKDLWIQSDTASLNIDLIGINLMPSSTTVMNVSKNELFTTITVLQGSVSVIVGSDSEEITAGKQLNYSTLRTLTIEDIRSRVTTINPDTLTSEWMTLNGASSFSSNATASGAGSTTITPVNTASISGGLILFESPVDESTVESKTMTVSGRVLSASVSRISINGVPATVDPVKQAFTLTNVSLPSKENNLVYRTYDVNGALLSKGIVTVYTTTPGSGTAGTSGGTATVETFKVDNRFKVTAPASDFYETRESKVKIEGSVVAKTAHHITINGYKLNSFAANGTSWYYFANQQFGTLDEGINLYNIQYFDSNDTEIYKQLFIIKKLPPFSSTKPSTTTTSTTTGTNSSTTTTTTGGQKEIIPSSALSDG